MVYLIVSDIHGNFEALKSVLSASQGKWEKILCLGDILGYGPEPQNCLQLLQDHSFQSVAGNHDWAAIRKTSSINFNQLARSALSWSYRDLNPESIGFIEDLPIELKIGAATIVHGSLTDPIRHYIITPQDAAENFALCETSLLFFGHSHLACSFLQINPQAPPMGAPGKAGTILEIGKGRFLLNPGSVGQPRDGDPRAAYALWDTENMTWEFCRTAYPIKKTQARMKSLGLPPLLYERLAEGH